MNQQKRKENRNELQKVKSIKKKAYANPTKQRQITASKSVRKSRRRPVQIRKITSKNIETASNIVSKIVSRNCVEMRRNCVEMRRKASKLCRNASKNAVMRRKASKCVEMCRDHVKSVENYIKKISETPSKTVDIATKSAENYVKTVENYI